MIHFSPEKNIIFYHLDILRITKYFKTKWYQNLMIIMCKGMKSNLRVVKCSFLHDGNWGDSELIEHQKFHHSQEKNNLTWLGFEVVQSIGRYSGRDGKTI